MSSIGTLPFNKIPANWREPLFFVEFDSTMANTALSNQRTLLIGQKIAAGSAVANVPVICSSPADAIAKCGEGSMLAMMMDAYRANDPTGEVWILPLVDDGAAVAATGTITPTAPATAAGTLYLYIAGILITVAIATGQTTAQLATTIGAAINSATNYNLPVTANVVGSVVTLTAVNKGAAANDIDIQFNYLGVAGGQVLPTGFAATIVPMASGATNPVLTTALTNCADTPFDFIVNPYTDATSLNALKSFLDDITGRWSFNRQVYGHSFGVARGSLGTLTTLGAGRNNQHESILGMQGSPNPVWSWAAAAYGSMAVALKADPARPMQTLVINGMLAPPTNLRFTSSDREAMLFSGISTFTVANDGTCALEKVITTYQFNAFGNPDNSWLGIEVPFQLMWLMRDLATYITSRYPRCKLAADGTRLAPGSGVVTPGMILADMKGHYRQLCYLGRAQNPAVFDTNAVLLQDPNNPNRLNFLWAGTLMDQLNVFATLAQFRNQ